MKTPLHLACLKADLGMVQLLLESEEADPSPQDAQGFTPLHYRQTLENADITKCLIQKEAAVDIPSKVYYSYMSSYIPYSWKYWWELNLMVEPKITIARILADLHLVVRYRIAIRIYTCTCIYE